MIHDGNYKMIYMRVLITNKFSSGVNNDITQFLFFFAEINLLYA